MNQSRNEQSGNLALAITPTVSGAGSRAGRASRHRRYRTSDGQTLLGYTSTIVGGLCLAAVLLGYLRGSEIVALFLVASFGLVLGTIWCAWERKFQDATIFGVLAGFNFSYALLQLGISNNWYSIPITDLTNVLSFYSVTWMVIFLLLSIVAFNSSIGAFVLFLSVDVSLGFVVAANHNGSISLLRWAALPIGVVLIVSTGFIAQVMWGWHRRNVIEAARARAGEAMPVADGITTGPVTNRRGAASAIRSKQ